MARKNVIIAILAWFILAIPGRIDAKTWEVTPDTTNPGQRVTNALANATNGDRIHIHGPASYTAPPGGWFLRKSIEFYGDGRGVAFTADSGTILNAYSASDPILTLDPSFTDYALQNVHIHDLQFRGKWNGTEGGASATGNGIVFDNASSSPHKLL